MLTIQQRIYLTSLSNVQYNTLFDNSGYTNDSNTTTSRPKQTNQRKQRRNDHIFQVTEQFVDLKDITDNYANLMYVTSWKNKEEVAHLGIDVLLPKRWLKPNEIQL